MSEKTDKKRPQSLLKRYLRYIGVFASLFVVGFLMYYFSSIVTWVVLAWVISLLGSPVVSFLGRIQYKGWQLPSSLRAILVLLLFYGVLTLIFYIFVPVIVSQGRALTKVDYKSIITSLEEPINNINDWLINRGFVEGTIVADAPIVDSAQAAIAADTTMLPLIPKPTPEPTLHTTTPITSITSISLDSFVIANGDTMPRTNINLNLAFNLETILPIVSEDSATIVALAEQRDNDHESIHEQIQEAIREYISPSSFLTKGVVYIVALVGNLLVLITSVTFIAFFFLKDEKLFGRALKTLVPKRRQDEMDTALVAIRRLLTRYFSGILVQITLITIYVTVLLSFFSVPNAFLIAFFAAIINVIPYLGPLLGAIFAGLVIISSNIDASFYAVTMPMLLKAAGVFVSMQIVDGFVLQPYIFSNSVSAHPLEIFIVVVIGAKLGGITGMIVAIPVYTIIRVIAAVFLKEFQIVQRLTHNIDYADGEHHLGENVDIEIEG